MIVFASLFGTQAFAGDEPPIGSRLGNRSDTAIQHDPKSSVQAGHQVSGCTFLKRPTAVRAALDSVDAAEAKRLFAKTRVEGTCINLLLANDYADSQRIYLPDEIYRGMLAEAALRLEFKSLQFSPLQRQPRYERAWFAVTGRPIAVDEMAACVADTYPAGVRALLATIAETPDERRAISDLSSWLGPCLTVGATLNANRQSLRAALAEALYHRAVAEASNAVVTK
jgi:hypothetical protein